MPVHSVIEPGFRDLAGRFIKVAEKIDVQAKNTVEKLGARWVELARAESPRRSGQFAESITYTYFDDQHSFGFVGTSENPLGQFIKFGTDPHPISARNVGALHFFWEENANLETFVPKRGGFKTYQIDDQLFIGKGYVSHPGTQPNPYHLRAFEKFWPEVQKEVRSLAEEFIVRLASPSE